MLVDNDPKFVSKVFGAEFGYKRFRHLIATTYHPQVNGQPERYNNTIVTRLRHYIANHQLGWDVFLEQLTYAYKTHVHHSTNTSTCSLELSRVLLEQLFLRANTKSFHRLHPSLLPGNGSLAATNVCIAVSLHPDAS